MNEPLFWNPLADAAAWLTQKTGRVMDARALVDTIAQMGRPGDPAPTIVKAMLSQGLNFAVVTIGATQPKSEAGKFEDDQLTKRYGPLPSCMSYLRAAFPTVAPLCVNHLLLLLMRGEVSLMFVDDPRLPNGAKIQLMPFGTEHTATLNTCGINRADLLALCEKLTQATATAETPKERRHRWLEMFEAEAERGERGALQRVAEREGVDRSNMSKAIEKAREERAEERRAGAMFRGL